MYSIPTPSKRSRRRLGTLRPVTRLHSYSSTKGSNPLAAKRSLSLDFEVFIYLDHQALPRKRIKWQRAFSTMEEVGEKISL